MTIYNAIGVPLESKQLDFEPCFAAVSKTHVIVANKSMILHCQFKVLANVKVTALDPLRRKEVKDRAFHIDEMNESTVEALINRETDDPISCITTSDNSLLVARESGILLKYSMPTIVLENSFTIPVAPTSISLNSNSTRCSLLDKNGVLKLFDLNGAGFLEIERKDVWDIKWASDNPEMFAIMEKTRVCIFKDLEPEQPTVSSGCTFV